MLKKLAPLMFQPDGEAVPPQAVLKQVGFGNVGVAAHEKGAHIEFTLAARDPAGAAMLARFSAKRKAPEPGSG